MINSIGLAAFLRGGFYNASGGALNGVSVWATFTKLDQNGELVLDPDGETLLIDNQNIANNTWYASGPVFDNSVAAHLFLGAQLRYTFDPQTGANGNFEIYLLGNPDNVVAWPSDRRGNLWKTDRAVAGSGVQNAFYQ